MSKAPSMPMYWDAYLADTTHLSTEEHGAYMLLLGAMWRRNGTVPDDDTDNARILGLSKAKWRKVKARLAEKPTSIFCQDGFISQKKLKKTWEKTQEKIQVNRENGALGGRPVLNKNKDLDKANGSDSLNPNETIPEPEPYKEKRDTKVSPKKASRLPPDWVLPKRYGEYAISQGWCETSIRLEADKFRDYWISKSGKDATKLDWLAVWRNWLRNSNSPKIKSINGGNDGKSTDASDGLQRIIGAAAAGTSRQNWG